MTKGELKLNLYFDAKTGIFTWLRSTNGRIKIGDIAGSLNKTGYLYISLNNKKYKAHRLAWFYVYGEMPKNNIDHINGIKTDNRIENLRDVTQSQNMMNYKIPTTNTSKVKGITFEKNSKKWRVRFKVDGKDKHFGLYEDFNLAKLVVEEARNKYHKEYARH